MIKIGSELRKKYQGKTILISGGRGYIGASLTQSLMDIECDVRVLDNSEKNAWAPEADRAKITILKGDITDRKTWDLALPGVDIFFHLAASEALGGFDADANLEINGVSVLRFLEVCASRKFSPKIVFSSSANAFGWTETMPVNEIQRDNPVSLWSAHKILAENYLYIYALTHKISSVILRLSNVFGPSAREGCNQRVVLNKVIMSALENKQLTMFANRNCKRDFVYIEDVVRAFLLAGVQEGLDDSEMFVVGSGESKTFSDIWGIIAEQTAKQTGEEVQLRIDDSVKMAPLELRNFVADTAKFHEAVGWVPQVTVTQGVERTVRHLAYK
jgi:UDP-glucose 4-epimerase